MFQNATYLSFIVPIAGAMLIPLVSAISPKARNWFAVAVAFATAAITVYMIPMAYTSAVPIHLQFVWISGLNITFGVLADRLSVFMANITGVLGALIILYSVDYMKGEEGLSRYFFFMLLFIGSMIGLVMADNFLQLLVFWEIVGICSYALIGFWNKDNYNVNCGTKAFIVTRVGDVLLLAGIFIIYHYSGTFSFVGLAGNTQWIANLVRAGLLTITPILLFGGAAGKSAQFPLHVWLPDAMAGPTSVSALIHAATMVNAGVYLVARILPFFYNALWVNGYSQLTLFFTIVAWIGAFTAFMAATQAVVARDLKRILAFSTISQLGYMMLALGISGLLVQNADGFFAATFYLMTHAVFKALLFLCAGAVIHVTETNDIFKMGGIRRLMPITFSAMLIGVLSLSGVPPLAGFWSKDAVLEVCLTYAKVGTQGYLLLGLASATAILTFFYSIRMIGVAFLGSKSDNIKELENDGHIIHDPPATMSVPLFLLSAFTLIGGFLGPWIYQFIIQGVTYSSPIQMYLHTFTGAAFPLTLGILVLGGVPAYLLYIKKSVSPTGILSKHRSLTKLHVFLENRWYIDAIYYKIFVDGTYKLCRTLSKYVDVAIDGFNYGTAQFMVVFSSLGVKFDVNVIDGFVNGVAAASVIFASKLRRIQTGITQRYVLAYMIGVIFLIIAVILITRGLW